MILEKWNDLGEFFIFFWYKIVLMFVDFDMLKFLCKCDEVMMEFKKLL